MKVFVVFFFCFIAAASCQHCYNTAKDACDSASDKEPDCTAKYGKANTYMNHMNEYANMHITRSLQYLLMSSHFGNYQKAREGFEKLYRKLSDTAWEDAIDIMKYVTLRGGKVELQPYFGEPREDNNKQSIFHQKEVFEMNEFESLSKAVDIQKKLAEEAHNIYGKTNPHDPEMGAFVEDKFMHKHAKTVRELVGHTNDLKRLINVDSSSNSVGVQVFLLDEYLQKTL